MFKNVCHKFYAGAIIFRTLPSRPKIQTKLIHAGFHLTTLIAVTIGLW